MQRKLIVGVALFVGVIGAGCSANKASTLAGVPVTKTEAQQFAEKLEMLVEAGDREKAIKLLGLDQLCNRTMLALGLDDETIQAMLQVNVQGMCSKRVIDNLIGDLGDVDRCKLLHIRMEGDKPHLLMRTIAQGVNYIDMTLMKLPSGEIVCEDMVDASTGELLSTTFKELLLELARFDRKASTGKMKSQIEEMDRLIKFRNALKQSDTALKLYPTLPASFKASKRGQLWGSIAADQAGLESATHDLEAYRKKYPDDLGVDIYQAGALSEKGKGKEALAVINRIDEKVGGDPYLACLRADAFLSIGSTSDAKRVIEEGLKRDPSQKHLHLYRIHQAINNNDFDDAVKYLKDAVENWHGPMNLAVFESNLSVATFIKSSQYGEWKKWLAMRQESK